MRAGDGGVVVGVQEHSTSFLQFLDRQMMNLGARVEVLEVFEFDESMKLRLNGESDLIVSSRVCQNLFLKKI